MLKASSPVKAAVLLAASAVAVSVTGATAETVLATITVPAGAMGLNGGIEIRTVWSTTNSANSKTLRARLGGIGGTAYLSKPVTAVATTGDQRRIRNRNNASSQVGTMSAAADPFTTSTTSVVTSAVDTSAAADVVITGQLALGTETITLESYEIWLLP